MTRWFLLFGLLATLTSCHSAPDKPQADGTAEPVAAPPRIGALMVETAQRFVLAGKARTAGRWELSAYEVGEIIELFDVDMSRAFLPDVCDDSISEPMFSQLLDHQLPALKEAAEQHHAALFAERYRLVSASCNTCHATCAVPFVEVPDVPGHDVPRMDPVDVQITATPTGHGEPEQAPPAGSPPATDAASAPSP